MEGLEKRAFDALKKFQISLKNLGGWVFVVFLEKATHIAPNRGA
jgi:hypothetical protein